jgi:hypothetical protein
MKTKTALFEVVEDAGKFYKLSHRFLCLCQVLKLTARFLRPAQCHVVRATFL